MSRSSPSLAALYREHVAFVWSIVRRAGVGEAEVEDAVHDVFVVAHRQLSAFEGRSSIKTWLYAIAIRTAWAKLRRSSRSPTDCPWTETDVDAADPEHHVGQLQAAELLERLLAKLDPDKRAVFTLAEIEGLRVAEIAQIVGAKPRTVTWRLAAAREQFGRGIARLRAQVQRELLTEEQLIAHAKADRPDEATQRRIWAGVVTNLPLTPPSPAPAALTQGSALTTSLSGASITTVKALWITAAAASALVITGSVHSRAASSPTAPSDDRVVTDTPHPLVATASPRVPALFLPAIPNPTPEVETRTHDKAVEAVETVSAPARTRRRTRAKAAHPRSIRTDALREEIELLERARSRLEAGDHKGAIAWLDRHQDRFSHGTLARERNRLRQQVAQRHR